MIARTAALALLLSTPLNAALPAVSIAAPETIVLGQSIRVASAVMGEERVINVSLPADYAKGEKRYPVLYLIDGGVDQDFIHVVGAGQLGAAWGRAQDAIVVGIATRDRRNELTGPTADKALLAKYPTAGQSARFRRFIRDEVKPMIAARYRTDGNDGVIGESLAGLFIAETWLREPALFRNYAAVSPSLWWDNAALTAAAPALMGKAQAGRRLFVTFAEEGGDEAAIDARFAAALGNRACVVPHREFTHATIYHAVVPAALQFLFPTTEKLDPQYGFVTGCQDAPQ
ncbi:alpha/beta hydrolase [Parablastomonas sp. CN1-191]|uniref:alpha/beta hydrolase n=1 Tax=Parablastomonas sp. CN1-191 TaxID=3400908 RepID=UPI003BF8314C